MYRRMFERSWAKRDSATRRALAPESATFTVRQGVRYRAKVILTWVESFAGNAMIADKLTQVGFKDVVVTGAGSSRIAEATWAGADVTAPLDSHLSNVEELEAEPVVAAAQVAEAPVAEPSTPDATSEPTLPPPPLL